MSFFATVLVVGLTLVAIGLLVLGLAATPAARLAGMHEDGPWWFSPRGGRTQGFVVAYLGLLTAASGGVGLLVRSAIPTGAALAWTLTWVTFVVLLAVTMTWAGRLTTRLATGGRGTWDVPVESDFIEPVIGADDPDLIAVRQEALEGRWQPAAHLLAATGDAEMRVMRIGLLAEVAGRRRRWLDAWLREHPDDGNALAVQAAAAHQRASELADGQGAGDPRGFPEALEDALAAAREAARVAPDDPSPWVTLLHLAELEDVERAELDARLSGAIQRAPGLRQAYEAAIVYREDLSPDSPDVVLAFAEEVAAQNDPGRTTALLPAVAHLAHYLHLVGTSPRAATTFIESEATRQSLRAASDRWLADPSPVCQAWGHNLMAFVGWLAEDPELAGAHLPHTAAALHPWPWLVAGEPSETHAQARAWARQRLADSTALAPNPLG